MRSFLIPISMLLSALVWWAPVCVWPSVFAQAPQRQESDKAPAAPPGDRTQPPPSRPEGPPPPGPGSPPAPAPVVYKPPLRGAPGGRVGGGARGVEYETLVVSALAPDHTGLTVHEQISLYWFVSGSTSSPLELTVIEDRAIHPVVEARVPLPVGAGLNHVRLEDLGVHLALGVPYRWYIAVINDAERRSKDILAGGMIQRIEPLDSLGGQLTQAGTRQVPFLYADAGLWYDAFATLSELIDGAPDDGELREQRASLLEQVGLREIAAYERSASRTR